MKFKSWDFIRNPNLYEFPASKTAGTYLLLCNDVQYFTNPSLMLFAPEAKYTYLHELKRTSYTSLFLQKIKK